MEDPKRSNKHGKLQVLPSELQRVMQEKMTQIEAAKELNISVSTLKRRLAELKLKWPNTKKKRRQMQQNRKKQSQARLRKESPQSFDDQQSFMSLDDFSSYPAEPVVTRSMRKKMEKEGKTSQPPTLPHPFMGTTTNPTALNQRQPLSNPSTIHPSTIHPSTIHPSLGSLGSSNIHPSLLSSMPYKTTQFQQQPLAMNPMMQQMLLQQQQQLMMNQTQLGFIPDGSLNSRLSKMIHQNDMVIAQQQNVGMQMAQALTIQQQLYQPTHTHQIPHQFHQEIRTTEILMDPLLQRVSH